MHKNIVIILVLVIVIGGGFYFFSQQSKTQQDPMMQKDTSLMQQDDPSSTGMMMQKNDNTMSDSRYVQYSQATLEQAAGKRRVLFFFASWCPTCVPTDEDLRANAGKLPEDVVVIRVNYNDPETDQEEKDLAKKYGIVYQHTFVQIDGQGNQVTKWNGGATEELLENIK